MPYGIEHGVPGLDGVHYLNNRVYLNQDAVPRYKLDRITGLRTSPDFSDNREPNYARGGEQVYPTNQRGKTVVYEGRIQARDLLELRQMETLLRLAENSGKLVGTGYMEIIPPAIVGGLHFNYRFRGMGLEIDDEWTTTITSVPTLYQQEFVMSLRMSDPRFYAMGIDVAVSGVSNEVKTIHNPGNAGGEPRITVNGPISGDLIFHRLDNFIDRNLTYHGISLAAGQQLVADFQNRTFTRVSDGLSFDHLRDFSLSNWWDPTAAGLNYDNTQVTVHGASWTMSLIPSTW